MDCGYNLGCNYIGNFEDTITERYEKDVENALNIMTNQHGVRLERMTYDREDHYTTLGDHRIQEAYNGVNILLPLMISGKMKGFWNLPFVFWRNDFLVTCQMKEACSAMEVME